MKLTNMGQSVMFKIYAFLVYLLPMVVLFIANFDAYTTDSKISFFGITLLIFVCIAFCNTLKKIINYNLGMTFSVIIFIIAIASKYLGEQLLLISGCSIIGSVLSLVFGAISNTYYRFAFIEDEQGRKRKDTSPAMPLKEAWKETITVFSDKE